MVFSKKTLSSSVDGRRERAHFSAVVLGGGGGLIGRWLTSIRSDAAK